MISVSTSETNPARAALQGLTFGFGDIEGSTSMLRTLGIAIRRSDLQGASGRLAHALALFEALGEAEHLLARFAAAS